MYARNREALIVLATLACIKPEDRPMLALQAEAQDFLDEFSVGDRVPFAVLTGRAVDRSGAQVRAQLTLTKVFDTVLWSAGGATRWGSRPS